MQLLERNRALHPFNSHLPGVPANRVNSASRPYHCPVCQSTWLENATTTSCQCSDCGREADLGLPSTLVVSAQQFADTLKESVQNGDMYGAISMFGNDSDAGLHLIRAAFPLLNERERATLLSDVWVRGCYGEHAIHARGNFTRAMMLDLFRQAGLLAELARETLGGPRTIYRGVPVRRRRKTTVADGRRGLAWTTRRDIAAWFAFRHQNIGAAPLLIQATAPPSAVLAFFRQRNEDEVIVDSSRLVDVRETTISPNDCEAVRAIIRTRQRERAE